MSTVTPTAPAQMKPAKNSEKRAMWLALLFGIGLLLCSFALSLAPKSGAKVAVFTVPWATNNQAIFTIARADANVAALGKVEWIAIATDDQINLVSRLYQAGAFLVIDAALLISCGVISN
ncbi:MAG: hypothetical protein COB24_14200 [Hyphomicrobiales bacterium]|nr:MAG: hypothetical protein COB24_14200 [Hyphomicrobiales bacterium]